jgi:hypothetical protein
MLFGTFNSFHFIKNPQFASLPIIDATSGLGRFATVDF